MAFSRRFYKGRRKDYTIHVDGVILNRTSAGYAKKNPAYLERKKLVLEVVREAVSFRRKSRARRAIG